jgi:redox-sensitive bicupin YhaK (pirin superfamily)
MKRTITTEVFAIASPYSSLTPEDLRTGNIGDQLMYSTTDMAGVNGYIVVGKGTVTVELHSANDVAANQVAVLREQVKTVQAEAQLKVDRLEDQIRNLQALTYEPTEMAA